MEQHKIFSFNRKLDMLNPSITSHFQREVEINMVEFSYAQYKFSQNSFMYTAIAKITPLWVIGCEKSESNIRFYTGIKISQLLWLCKCVTV